MDYVTIGLLVAVLSVVVTSLGIIINMERSIREELRSVSNRLANAINGVGDAIVEYLGLKGVLNPGDVYYLRAVIKGLVSTVANPLTAEERRRLLELVDKDDLTIEEAEELHKLARKFYEEYIDKTPDAFKVLFYAAAMLGITYRKYALGKQTSQPPT